MGCECHCPSGFKGKLCEDFEEQDSYDKCGQRNYTEAFGYITTSEVNRYMECIWILKSENFWDTYNVTITFDGSNLTCVGDHLTIEDGKVHKSFDYCSSDKVQTYSSTSNFVVVSLNAGGKVKSRQGPRIDFQQIKPKCADDVDKSGLAPPSSGSGRKVVFGSLVMFLAFAAFAASFVLCYRGRF